MKWENKFITFNLSNGPKVIMETLDTYGKEGWELTAIVTVGDGLQLVAFLKRRFDEVALDPEEGKKAKLASLWGGDEE